MEEMMNKQELQNFLDEEAREGKTKEQAFDKFLRIEGVSWNQDLAEKKKDSSQPTKQ